MRSGNFELVKHFVDYCADNWGYGFNALHKNAILQGPDVATIKMVKKSSLMKKALDALQLTPMHIAAVNPDPSVFKLYFKQNPTSMVLDSEQRDLVHYAVANHNPDVLKFLIQKKVEINNRDAEGNTPLMIACKLGRLQSVQLILEE